MIAITDQIDRPVSLAGPAQRIVCLVPSITELLFDLGLGERIVGRTKFCIHPSDKVGEVAKVGGTKTVDVDAVHELKSDLIIASKEENVEDQVMAACEQKAAKTALYVSDVTDLYAALAMIADIGHLTGTLPKAEALLSTIQGLADDINTEDSEPALYLIWRKPYMSVGGDTYISNMMPYAGYHNILAQEQRYPTLTEEEIKHLAPRHILLSSEPFPFAEKHIQELQALCPEATIKLVDGEHYSWYGSRMIQALRAFGESY